MTINFTRQVYMPTYDVFARPAVFTPLKSQPNGPAYTGRGIFGTQAIDVLTEESLLSDAKTIFDIIEAEYSSMPAQGDRISIPATGDLPAMGDYEINDVNSNGVESTLFLRKLGAAKP